MNVTKLKDATFLLRFERQELRNAALGRGLLSAGHTRLHLMPWTRQFGATAASKLPYRVRVCIEGIPEHAAHIEVLSKLFPPNAIIDELDTVKNSEDEVACVWVWLSVADPDSIAVEGRLSLRNRSSSWKNSIMFSLGGSLARQSWLISRCFCMLIRC